jgi:hypothetical protein
MVREWIHSVGCVQLRAANEKQVKNSQKSKKQIPHQGSLTIEEGAQLLQAAQVADEAMEEVNLPEASDALNTRQRAPLGAASAMLSDIKGLNERSERDFARTKPSNSGMLEALKSKPWDLSLGVNSTPSFYTKSTYILRQY